MDRGRPIGPRSAPPAQARTRRRPPVGRRRTSKSRHPQQGTGSCSPRSEAKLRLAALPRGLATHPPEDRVGRLRLSGAFAIELEDVLVVLLGHLEPDEETREHDKRNDDHRGERDPEGDGDGLESLHEEPPATAWAGDVEWRIRMVRPTVFRRWAWRPPGGGAWGLARSSRRHHLR